MNTPGLPIVLVAEDDPAERLLIQEAFLASGIQVDLRFVGAGAEFPDYLHRRPPWQKAERPDLILLDLNVSRTAGCEVLREIKNDRDLRPIPVVVLTSAQSQEDITEVYACGANTCIPKPSSLQDFAPTVKVFCEFWFRICALPGTARQKRAYR